MLKTVLTLCMTLMLAVPAFADVKVVATLPWIASIVKEIGKNHVTVTTLVKPTQDPHYLEAKPSMVLAARRADMLIYNGLDLEIGYLPVVIESSKNPKIAPGKLGNFDCGRFVKVIEKLDNADRSMGDVHPAGNPHYHYSPSTVLRVAEGMMHGLSEIDPANASAYRANFKLLSARFAAKQRGWQAAAAHLRGKNYVAYHKHFSYLAKEYGFKIVGYLEPKPGLPPTASHIQELVGMMKSKKVDGILTAVFYSKTGTNSLSGKTGVKVITLPPDVGAGSRGEDYFAFMDKTLALLR